MQKLIWSRYVAVMSRGLGRGSAISRLIRERLGEGPSQPTVDRWLAGTIMPTGGREVAQFARAFGRPPLEAMVAAGILSLDEARTGLPDSSVRLLLDLDERPYSTLHPDIEEHELAELAAHEEEHSIESEQGHAETP
jgi:hypothetical protein